MFAKNYGVKIAPDYNHVDGFNRYPQDIMLEYVQSIEEGLDIEKHKDFSKRISCYASGCSRGFVHI